MSGRAKAATALAACIIHIALLVPLTTHGSPSLERRFFPDAERTLDGKKPYQDVGFEYPPLALPLFLGPALIGNDPRSFAEAFSWEMIAVDLALVLVLALAVPAGRQRVWAALGVYTVGVALLTGAWLFPDSATGEALPLARFDLLPALLVLGAVLAREANRTASWSFLLSAGTAVKAFPVLLYPLLWKGKRDWVRVVAGAAAPLIVAIILVVALGDDFGSAVGYHTGRNLQVESLGASLLMIAHLLFGAHVATEFSSGSWNLVADGSGVAKTLSLATLVAAYTLVVWRARTCGTPPFEAALAALTVAVVFAPILSPQFLYWVLPLSAIAYGLRWPNIVLLLTLGVTAYVLHQYRGVRDLTPNFVLAISLRNLLLLVYLALILRPLLSGSSSSATTRRLGGEHAPKA